MAADSEVKRHAGIVVAAIVLAVLLVGYIGYGYFSKSTTAASQIAPINVVGKGAKTSESPHYNDVQRKFDTRNADHAEASGGTYIAALSTMEQPVKPVAPKPEQRAAAAPAPQQAHYVAPMPVTGGRYLSKNDMQSLVGMMKNWSDDTGIVAAKVDQEPGYASAFDGSSAEGAGESADAGSAALMAALQQKVIVAPYATTYAQLLTEIDTDESSMVRAVVPPGQPYAGATLYANGYKRLNNDVDLTFDAMLYQGHSYKIDAKPVDLETSRTALSGDVHHHYFTRIVLPAVASGLAATGQLFANSNQQTIVTPQGGIITTSPSSPSMRNIAGTFAGGLGQNSAQVLTQEAAQIPAKQTIVRRGEMIGIQFIGPVLASDDLQLAKPGAQPTAGGGSVAAAPALTRSQTQAGAQPAALASPQPHLPAGLRFSTAPSATGFAGTQ
ncbi:conjugal transfer protein TraO [Dyella ginsengisoli]|uniref:conjugal transfer protein TraO n=1 Tax=Dyella ginsengisoli TaxID=363848 RepID=UPI00034915D4|nr:conjugal transfer protein TraO [Dyella ginsengisoli]